MAHESALEFINDTEKTTTDIREAQKRGMAAGIELPVITMVLKSDAFRIYVDSFSSKHGQIMVSWFAGTSKKFPSREMRRVLQNLQFKEVSPNDEQKDVLSCVA